MQFLYGNGVTADISDGPSCNIPYVNYVTPATGNFIQWQYCVTVSGNPGILVYIK
jgi:hypothetical protein